MKELPNKYDPKAIEERIYAAWEKEKLFHADNASGKKVYTIVIPPPNVTGALHMGHALNNSIQDILIRWKRMQGFETLWVPGTDHAGIATQNVVEKSIAKEGLKRDDLGREKFLEKVWQWKESYGSTIIKQLKKLGSSCDWDRTRFTMDEGLSKAVMEVFSRLYAENLLYKGDYIINWCPRCGTALSDEEAEHEEVNGALYHIKYQIKGSAGFEKYLEDYVVVATTRPETLLGDTAIAVNPKDERYAALNGKTAILPLVGRELKIIFDEDVDPLFGTGALKVTPAHDPVDFLLSIKHGLPRVNVMESDASINALGGKYAGLDRFECRKKILEDLETAGLLVEKKDHLHAVGHCYRCHTMVEPRLSKQWFVKMKPLAIEAARVVEDGTVKFYPSRWTKVYLNWMHNIKDWCISRQIWWGHRIPVWYCKDCLKYKNVRDVSVSGPKAEGIFLSTGGEKLEKCPRCGGKDIEQDPDVLDTWFSSWLWPFSTLGWPKKTKDLEVFYPTEALVTAQEIIFFWVARMIMAGLKFGKEAPFKDVYIHGTVRDSSGKKMSKSLGNVIDPLDIINDVGSDALRFSIISITSQGQDVFLSKDKFESGRNFANKIWNAARYVLLNVDEKTLKPDYDISSCTLPDKWIISSFHETVKRVDSSLAEYRFSEAAGHIYDFIWHKYCDWYLEISKLSDDKANTQNILVYILGGVLKLLHPIMPFITEEIWQSMPARPDRWIMKSAWPAADEKAIDRQALSNMENLMGVITAVRNARAFWNININTILEVEIKTDQPGLIFDNRKYIEKLARCTVVKAEPLVARPANSVSAIVDKLQVFIPIGKLVDINEEKARISKKIQELENYLTGIARKLSDENFVKRAPADIIEKERSKQGKFSEQLAALKDNLEAVLG
ncbi:MAG: valine--tRNA ligase [Candidatus Omnitrophica bacterium]|nr:valine--tRNA ligase [Candidatus Omnitrophota bacterium]